jgi:hypothetical protein
MHLYDMSTNVFGPDTCTADGCDQPQQPNPSGAMRTAADFAMLVSVCKEACVVPDSDPPSTPPLPWIVVDQTYYEFVHHGPAHVFPNFAELGYPNQLIQPVLLLQLRHSRWPAGGWATWHTYPGALHAVFRKVDIPLCPPPPTAATCL